MMTSCSGRSIPTIDRISKLPDSILSHILSFLPTKEAAATIILSKSWKHVWLSILTLHFDYKTFNDFNSFHKFVYLTMFKLRDKKTPIHSFTLKLGYSSRFTQKHYDRIFKFVMKQGCVNLDFNLKDKYQFHILLPHSILNFKTLQVLSLTRTSMRDFDQVDFPHLKSLSLDSVNFKSRECYLKFLFGCPVLEDLHTRLIKFNWQDNYVQMKNLIALPNLIKVRFYDTDTPPLSLICKAKIFHVEKMSIFWAWLPVFHNLTQMELSIHDNGDKLCNSGNSTWLLRILEYFPKLQHFIIQDCGHAKNSCNFCWKHSGTTPECISSQLKTCSIRGYKGEKYEFEFVKYIMEYSKVLETMIVKSSTCLLQDQKDQMLLKLSSCVRGSTTCQLLFD